jgi:DNA-binding NarL/FixJ family response regulator
VSRPADEALQVIAEIRQELPGRAVVVLDDRVDGLVYDLLQAGVGGYAAKTGSFEELRAVLRAVAAGRPALAVPAVTRLVRVIQERPSAPAGPAEPPHLDGLSRREDEVLRLLADGRSNRAISQDLGLAESTVLVSAASV